VTGDRYARVCLEIDLDADLMAGVVRAGDGVGEQFSGWIAMTRAIEQALDAARSARDRAAAPNQTT
jgi:hypothetical protein